MDRRSFLAAGAAAAAASFAAPATAQRRVWTMPEEFKPRVINLQGELPVGEIHVDPNRFALYWTLPEGKAIK